MILASFGCSFVWGTDLPDCSPTQPSALSWPALLAQDLGHEYRCFAQGGRGNLFIAHQILCEAHVADLVVINWTYLDRYDIRESNGQWSTCLPSDPDHSRYFERYQNDYQDKLLALFEIKNCIDYLRARDKAFVMTAQDLLLFDFKYHTSAATYRLQKEIRPYFLDFGGINHLDWAVQQGHSITTQGHLLGSGHRAVADYVLGRINTNTNKEPTCNSQKISTSEN